MKKIGIDARLYFQTGVGVYIRNLLHYLEELQTPDLEFYIYVMKEDADRVAFSKKNFITKAVTEKWHTLLEQSGFLQQLLRDQLDLMHFTYFSHPVLYNRPFVSTIHDITILEHKTGRASTKSSILYNLKHMAFRYALSHQVKKSKAVITPTHTVKDQIVKIYGSQYADKITVLYEGVDYKKLKVKGEEGRVKGGEKLPEKYFLYVGNFYPHKNVERLLSALAKVQNNLSLVLVGPNDFFSRRMQEQVKTFGIEDRVRFCFNAPDEELLYLYSHALALVHPSLSEGVGLPLVEAAYMNIPVIASNIPVYKEILGDTYLAFDPLNSDDIAQKLTQFTKVNKKPDYEHVMQAFSFPLMAKNTLQIYKSAL